MLSPYFVERGTAPPSKVGSALEQVFLQEVSADSVPAGSHFLLVAMGLELKAETHPNASIFHITSQNSVFGAREAFRCLLVNSGLIGAEVVGPSGRFFSLQRGILTEWSSGSWSPP